MGSACASEAEAGASLEALDAERARARDRAGARLARARARRARAARDPAGELRRRSTPSSRSASRTASTWRGPLRVPAGDGRALVELALPVRAPAGAHAAASAPARDGAGRPDAASRRSSSRRAAACSRARSLGDARALGLWASLYTVRSQRGFGFGDFADLARLARLAAELGADFVAINPLHALLRPRRRDRALQPAEPDLARTSCISTSRPCRSSPTAPRRARALAAAAARARCAPRRELDYEAVLDAKLGVLRELHACFARARARARERARPRVRGVPRAGRPRARRTSRRFAALQAELGEPRLAALARALPRSALARGRGVRARDTRARSSSTPGCSSSSTRSSRAPRAPAREAGLALGLVKDLAIGSAADSADTWANPELFAHGRVARRAARRLRGGRPGLGPAAARFPQRLRAQRLRLSASGAARGVPPRRRAAHRSRDGTRAPVLDSRGPPGQRGRLRAPAATTSCSASLALESRRAAALVIGEDLGTVPPELGPELASWGILSTRVLCFERNGPRFRASRGLPGARARARDDPRPAAARGLPRRPRPRDPPRARRGSRATRTRCAGAKRARAEERAALIATLRDEGELPAGDDADRRRRARRRRARVPRAHAGAAGRARARRSGRRDGAPEPAGRARASAIAAGRGACSGRSTRLPPIRACARSSRAAQNAMSRAR